MEYKTLEEEEKCERCKAKNSFAMDMRNGEYVCTSCGNVAEDRLIDDTYEKRNFGAENGGNKSESRIGGPMKAGEGSNLGSTLITIDKDGNAKKVKLGGGAYNQSSLERNFLEIASILKNKDISDSIVEETKKIYSEVIKELKMKGRNFNEMVYAMYFIASRRQNVSKSFKEIAQMFNVKESKIKKAFNHIKKVVSNALTIEQQNSVLENYITDFCNSNGINEDYYEFKSLAITIAKNINESGLLDGKNTKTIAGLSLYIATKLENSNNIGKAEIIDAFISGNTIDSSYNQISDSFDKIIPEKYKGDIEKLKKN